MVTSSPSHLAEAITSATSCRAVDPAAHITLIHTPDLDEMARRSGVFDARVVREAPPPGAREAWLFKAARGYPDSPYQRTILLDSDTYFAASCRDLFGMLDYCDLAMCPAPVDIAGAVLDDRLMPSLTPYNSGVIVFRKSGDVEALFAAWARHYREHMSRMSNDQQAFIEVLCQSPCRVFPLLNNWNARIPFPDRFRGPVRLLHGRHHDLPGAARRLNVTNAGRIWIPWLDGCVHTRMSLADLLRLAASVPWRRRRKVGRSVPAPHVAGAAAPATRSPLATRRHADAVVAAPPQSNEATPAK